MIVALGMFLSTAAVLFAPTGSANTALPNSWHIKYNAATMEQATEPTYEYSTTGLGTFYHLGDLADPLTITICNDGAAATNDATGLTATLFSSDPAISGTPKYTGGSQVIAHGTCGDLPFTLNFSTSGTLAPHGLVLNFTYIENAVAGSVTGQNVAVDLVSAFDPILPATPTGHTTFPALAGVAPAPAAFYTGQGYQSAALTPAVTNHLGVTISGVEMTLGTPSIGGVALSGGVATSFDGTANVGLGPATAPAWRLDVGRQPSLVPGTYTIPLTINYNRTIPAADPQNPGTVERITESGTTLSFQLGASPILVATLVSPSALVEGQFTPIQVTFQNVGNVQLQGLNITPSVGGLWIGDSAHYEGATAVNPAALYIPSLAPGASTPTETLNISHALTLPAGVHRIAFNWNGWQFFPGTNSAPTVWSRVGGQIAAPVGGVPGIGFLYADTDNDGTYVAGVDGLTSANWPGAFVDVPVTDPSGPAFQLSAGTIPTATTANVLVPVTILNNEHVQFVDMVPWLKVGPGTPFLAPGNPSATAVLSTSAPFTLNAGAANVVSFLVDINTAWAPSATLATQTYTATVVINSTNHDTGVRTLGQAIPVPVGFVGFGPNLVTTATSNGPIVPGQAFTLNVTIQNVGDDTARNIEVAITAPAETLTLLQDFFNPGRNVSLHMSDFGASSFNDMVLGQALAQRTLSSPSAKVVHIHIDRLNASASQVVQFTLVADSNLIPGVTYPENIAMTYSGSRVAGPFTKGPLSIVLTPAKSTTVTLTGSTTSSGLHLPTPGPSVPFELGAVALAAGVFYFARRGRR
ncbi:MAG: COG1361 family protein [Thermoplasmatota archaeon]